MKRRGLIVVIALVVLLTGWWGFQRWQMYSASVWKLLPENAFFLIQSRHLQDTTYKVQRGGIEMREVPLLNLAARQVDMFRQLSDDKARAENLLKGQSITYVLQKTAGGRFAYLVFLPMEAFQSYAWLEAPASKNVRVTSHIHSGQKIYDVTNPLSEPIFAYTFFNNFLVSCVSGDVLEDWVRFAQSPLRTTNTSRFESIKQESSELSIYLDNVVLSEAIRREAATSPDAGLLYFLSFLPGTEGLHLDKFFSTKNPTLTSQGKKVRLEGYVEALNDQKASPLNHTFFIPNTTAVMYRLGFENSDNFVRKLRPQLEALSTDSVNRSRKQLLNLIGNARLDTFYRSFNKELILCQLEPNNSLTKGQIILQQVQPKNGLEPFFRRLSILFNKNTGTPFEPFQGGYVYNINWHELPAVLFGGLFKGFPKCYVAFHKNFVVYANDSQVLKDYLIDLEYQRTWANSSLYNTFLKTTLGASNLTFIVNPRKSKEYMGTGFMNYLFTNLNYDITEKLPFDQLVFQSAYKNGKAYSSLTFGRLNKATSAKTLNKVFLQQEKPFETPPAGGIYLVRNYPSSLEKTIVVTPSRELQNPLLEENKRKITQLDAPIVGDIYSVDFLSIGRLQYVFATQKSLNVIDEDDRQRYLSLPPITLPAGRTIRSFQRLESGIEGSFRFLVIDTEGFLYLWNSPNQAPVVLNRSRPFVDLLLPINEVEYMGKRHFLFTQGSGQVGLISESGVIPSPYKLELNTNFSGPFFGVFTPENGTTTLIGISKYGELFEITLGGQVKRKVQLFRSDPTSFFRARAAINNRDWILFRESETQFAVLDKQGKELFSAQGLIPFRNDVQYHFLGSEVKFLSVKSGNFTTLYNLNGTQIGDKPIPSEIPIRVNLVEGYNKLLIHSYANKKLQTWSLKIR
ncbi:hypothetical protein [Runella salmonicolor]|uniref:Uncharacterized protein n=1 Tax=Runella salmonicolor TaxID=2950278 RepID=A0ABT1FV61_9BACT|nr:hypothetical protein [Runella salmonicolor]MCP1384377.1 hypothetical protein [Runella salmonicolor]